MTSTRPTRHGRGGAHAAVVPPAPRTSRKRVIAGGLSAVMATGALVTIATTASAGTPPSGPGNIEIFPMRDMVAIEGYTEQAGLDASGFLEFNHTGGECWIGVTPTIKPGDEVKVSFSGAAFTDSAITASPTVTEVSGSGFTPSGEVVAGDPANRVRGTGQVTIAGTYDPADPTPTARSIWCKTKPSRWGRDPWPS